MTNILEKLNKPLLLAILGPFCPFLGKNMFLQNWTLPVFRFSNYLTSFKKKTNERLPRKTTNSQT